MTLTSCYGMQLWIVLLTVIISNGKFIKLRPVKCRGTYTISKPDGSIDTVFAAYLTKEKLEIIEHINHQTKEKSVILCDVLPIFTTISRGGMSLAEQDIDFRTNKNAKRVSSIMGVNPVASSIEKYDGGLYDNLPSSNADKKSFYDKLTQLKPPSGTSPMQNTANIIEDHFKSRISRLIIDPQDEFRNGLALGGCVRLTRNDESTNTDTAASDMDKGMSVDCFTDEVIALSLALDLPIFVDEEIVEALTTDAKLIKNDIDNSILSIQAPVRNRDKKSIKTVSAKDKLDPTAPLAWEIYDPKVFFRLSTLEKREILRASGVKNLPKPRLGEMELDSVLLDLMDDAVRGEIFRIQSKLPVPKASDDDSSRQQTLALMGEALETGNIEEAERLREKFALSTVLRADPTQEVGSYDRYLDQDDWYMQARRKALAPKKPQS